MSQVHIWILNSEFMLPKWSRGLFFMQRKLLLSLSMISSWQLISQTELLFMPVNHQLIVLQILLNHCCLGWTFSYRWVSYLDSYTFFLSICCAFCWYMHNIYNVILHFCSILISHLEGTQLIFAQGSTNLIQPRTENKSLLGLIITLMIDSILRLVRPCAFLFLLECITWHMETDYILWCCSCSFTITTLHQFELFMGSQI